MRLPYKLASCVNFANWCTRENQEPAAVARLLVMAAKAKRAGEVSCNTGERVRYEKTMLDFEKMAAELGYSVDWPGLWPILSRGGYDVCLPDV